MKELLKELGRGLIGLVVLPFVLLMVIWWGSLLVITRLLNWMVRR